MSFALYAKPAPPPVEGEYVGMQLKYALADREGSLGLFPGDGSLRTEPIEVGSEFVPILRAIGAGGSTELREECETLKAMIERLHPTKVQLWIGEPNDG